MAKTTAPARERKTSPPAASRGLSRQGPKGKTRAGWLEPKSGRISWGGADNFR
jgi:hypothetical protein